MVWMWSVMGVLAVSGTIGPVAGLRADDTEPPPQDAPAMYVVTRGELVLAFEREGRIDSAMRRKVRVDCDAYRGALTVVEVVRRAGPVVTGDVLLRLDTAQLEDHLRAAEESLHDAQRSLDIACGEERIMLDDHAMRLESAQRAKDQADHELAIWEQFNSERMLRAARLSVEGRENSLADQKEELAQLEFMYEGTRLDSDTKEIVLERARRRVRISEEWLEIVRNDTTITREYRHGEQDRRLREDARHRVTELANATVKNRFAHARKELGILSAQRRVRDAEQQVTKLRADLERMVVTAPVDGIITAIDLQPDDTVGNQQVLTEVLDPNDLVVNVSATAEDLRVIGQGSSIVLSVPAFQEIELTGTVRELSTVGVPSGDATHFAAVVGIDGSHHLLRIGLRCIASAEAVITDALLIPVEAVTETDAGTICRILVDGEAVERAIRLGAVGDEMMQVASGLAEGERVLLGEADDEAGE